MIVVKPPMAPTRAELFLAGGISNCPDWQAATELALSDLLGVVHNPRRPGVLVADEAVGQIEWEFEALRLSETILFWFPKDTVCPITLYELGVWATKGAPLIVGTDPKYTRQIDVFTQLRLARPDVIVHDSLDAVITQYREDMTA